jgi:hypothetical protein
MGTSRPAAEPRGESIAPRRVPTRPGRGRAAVLTGGGTDGNEQLTALTGVALVVLLAVIGVTILRIQQLISVHLFVGLLLVGPVALKMASTGYRFARYYSGDAAYRRKGRPEPLLRLIAPVVVLSTVVVFASGIVLLFEGPSHRGQLLTIHKASFIIWLLFTGLHVLGHLPRMRGSLHAVGRANTEQLGLAPGRAGRWTALAGALAGGLIIAVILIPQFAAWSQQGAFFHRH